MSWPLTGTMRLSLFLVCLGSMYDSVWQGLQVIGVLDACGQQLHAPAIIGGILEIPSPNITLPLTDEKATAILTLDVSTPFATSEEDNSTALLPISSQIRQLQDARISSAPRLVNVASLSNGTETRLTVEVDVRGDKQQVADLLRRAFSVNAAIDSFDISL